MRILREVRPEAAMDAVAGGRQARGSDGGEDEFGRDAAGEVEVGAEDRSPGRSDGGGGVGHCVCGARIPRDPRGYECARWLRGLLEG